MLASGGESGRGGICAFEGGSGGSKERKGTRKMGETDGFLCRTKRVASVRPEGGLYKIGFLGPGIHKTIRLYCRYEREVRGDSS